MRFLRTRRAAFIVMLIAGAACVIMQFVFAHNKPWEGEEPYYIAKNILAGNGYSYQFDGGALQQTCYIPPGYVAILLALWKIGFSDTGVQFINAIIYMLSAVIAYRIARKLGQSRGVSFLAFLAVAFYPPLWILAFVPSPNAINIFLVLLSVEQLLVTRKSPSLKNFLFLGVLFVVQLYIRPDVLVWAPLSVLWLWYVTKDKITAPNFVKYTLAAVVLSAVFVSPWTIRNYVVFHRFVLISANGGSNLWIGNNPAADGEFPPTEPGKPLIQDSIISRLDHVAQDSLYKTRALDYIYSHPARTAEMFFMKVYYHWWMRPHMGEYHEGSAAYQKMYMVLYGAVLLCTIWGLIVLFRRGERRGASLILMVFLYSTLIAGIFFTQTRHRMIKAEPLMLLCAAIAIGSVIDRRKKPEKIEQHSEEGIPANL